MKQYIGLSILMLGISGSAFASTSFCTTTLASNTGCTITNATTGASYTIDDFTFLGVTVLASNPAASNVGVTFQFDGNGNPEVTLTPDATFEAGPSLATTELYLLGFDIVSNQANIDFSSVNLGETSILTAAPLTGLLSAGVVAEEDCYGGAIPSGLSLLQIASLGNGGVACTSGGIAAGASVALSPGVGANANVPIPLPLLGSPSSSVDVLKELSLTAALGASAEVTGITQDFSLVSSTPEPGTYFLGGCGLVLIALFRPRKFKNNVEK